MASTIVDVTPAFSVMLKRLTPNKMDFRLLVVQVHEAGWTYLD